MQDGPENAIPTGPARVEVMENAREVAGAIPAPRLRSLICPFCGVPTLDTGRCQTCHARFDPLSRQATQNQMGPWSIRDEQAPFRPGCTYETLVRLIEQGVVRADTIIRGPTTRQFWTQVRHTPSVSQRVGVCHNCQHAVEKESVSCPSCHASFLPEMDRQHMGVGPSRIIPGQPATRTLKGSSPAIDQPQTPPTPTQHVGPSGYTDDAIAVIRQWRRAFNAERRRAWIAVGLAGIVTLIALVSGVAIVQRAENAGVHTQVVE